MKRFLLLAASGALLLQASALAAGSDVGGKRSGSGLVPPPPAIKIVLPPGRPALPPVQSVLPVSDPNRVVVGSGGPYTLTGRGNEQFSGTFSWKPDAPTDPLTLQATVSGPMRWIRVSLGSRLLATEKDFLGKDSLTFDLTGSVDSGVNQILVQAGGRQGDIVKWTLTSVLNPKMLSVDPDEVLQGEKITIKGQNFPTDPAKLSVQIGKKAVPVKTASQTELKLEVPKNMDIDEHNVTVWLSGKKIPGSAKLIVRGIPRLSNTNINGCPPGYPITIFGTNFSKKLAENQVWVGEAQAQLSRAAPLS